MLDFICIGLLDQWGAQTKNYKKKYCWPQWYSNPEPFAYEANSLSVALLVEISNKNLNVDRV